MILDFLTDGEKRMRGAIKSLEEDLAAVRTGRASPHLLDKLVVELYGAEMPLNQVALVSVPEPQQLGIRPFDLGSLKAIERIMTNS